MTWIILLIKKADNGWFINYIENKLNNQILKNKLQQYIDVVVYEPNTKFVSDYVSVIDECIEITDDFISVIFNKLKYSHKDCIGLNGVLYLDKQRYEFSNEPGKYNICLPITKLNPIKRDIILKLQNIAYYLAIEKLSNYVETIDFIDKPVVFFEKNSIKVPISIIVTAYQTQDYIEECLDSIENQIYFKDNDDFEVLVGVDACQDTYNKLEEIKHKYRNLSIYMMSENKGTYITTNTLIDLVKNEDVIRFDSDDIMTPGLVIELLKNKKDNDIVLMGSVDLNNGNIGIKFLMTEGIIYFKKSMMDNIAGGYMPWRCSADTELISRVINKVKVSQIKKVLFYRRIHSKSLTQNSETGYGSAIRQQYKSQIKSKYKDNEIKIERVVNKVVDTSLFIKKVSFIITAYKTQDYIEECLDSIERQNCIKEILVGVDACQDTLDKLDIIKYKYQNLKVFWFPKNSGTYLLKNTLATEAKYDILSFFDSDDIMVNNYITKKLSKLKDHSIVRSMYSDFDKNGKIDVNYHSHGVMLINKNDFFDLNGFFDRRVASDLDFLNRWKNMNYEDIKIDEYLIKRRLHENNLSFCEKTGMQSIFRKKIHEEIDERNNNKITKNSDLVTVNFTEIKNEAISFCIPAYKSEKFLEECLDSIERQNCIKEILVGVDGCKDTLLLLKKIGLKYTQLRIFWFPKNIGTSAVKNTLATKAKYNILSFFDSDDIMNDDYSDYVLKYINHNNIIRFKFYDFDEKETIKRNYCANGVMSIFKDNFLKLNGFWEFRVTEDLDFVNRWKKIGDDIQLNTLGFKRRIHNNNISFNEKTGCYGDYGKKLLNISTDRCNNNKIINDKLIISKCNEIFISINDYFDKIYCLNLDRRPDKWKNVKEKFDKLNLKVERFSAVDGNNITDKELKNYNKINKYEIGCMLSHYKIIEDAKNNNYSKILIFEDDVLFSENFHLLFKEKIKKLSNWKLLYFGATQYQWNDIEFIDDFYYSNHTDGTFAFAIDQSIYDDILKTDSFNNKPIDYKLWDIQKKYYNKCYTIFPNLVISDVSDSDIRDRREPSNHNIKMKWNLYNYE